MANAMTLTSTWTSEYVPEVFLKPVFMSKSLENYNVDPTVNRSKTVYLADKLESIIREKSTCGFDAAGNFAIGEKVLATKSISVNLEQCAREFEDSVFKQALKRGTDVLDLSDTIIADAMQERVNVSVINDNAKIIWFGDTTISGTSDLEKSVKIFDGWFRLLENGLPSSNKVSISETGDLGADAALGYLREVYEASDELFSIDDNQKKFHVTKSIGLNLLKTYEQLGTDSGLMRLEDGQRTLQFRGIDVVIHNEWDTTINALGLSNPHRIVYTTMDNLMVGTDIVTPASDAKLFFDELEEKYYYKAIYDLGVQYMFDEHVVYAR